MENRLNASETAKDLDLVLVSFRSGRMTLFGGGAHDSRREHHHVATLEVIVLTPTQESSS